MLSTDPQEFALLLAESRRNNPAATAQLLTLVYQDLRRLAQCYLSEERRNHTLQATALVHEAYLRLFGDGQLELESRAHFFVVAARQMRRILIDHARQSQAAKRQGYHSRVPLEAAAGLSFERDADLLALDDALDRLAVSYPRTAQAVELRFFSGLTEKEAAEALGVSLATLKRDWTFAKAWLRDQLTRLPAGSLGRGD